MSACSGTEGGAPPGSSAEPGGTTSMAAATPAPGSTTTVASDTGSPPAPTGAPSTATTTPAAGTTTPATTTPATTTTATVLRQAAAARPAPLRGTPITDPSARTRPALVVKIDNTGPARPQVGVELADLVIEEQIEAGGTRLFAVFQSEVPRVAGPVRSARTQDFLIVPMLGRPLFACSGGNAGVRSELADAQLVDVCSSNGAVADLWYRDDDRQSPHNLFVKARELYREAPADSGAPQQVFRYTERAITDRGTAVTGARLSIGAMRLEWRWDGTRSAWVRTQNGSAHRVESGTVLTAANVVLLEVRYATSAADERSPEAQTVGDGRVVVLTNGRAVEGTWRRDRLEDPWELRDADGRVIELAPGVTWVELVRPGHSALVPAGVDPATVPFPQG